MNYETEIPIHNQLLTGREVASVLNISPSFAFKLLRSGKIPAIRLGRSVARSECEQRT